MTLTQSLAKLILSSSPSPAAHEAAREGLLDFLAVTCRFYTAIYPMQD
ncbi:Uncharacterised protein [Serratia rubidaea]|uniref:Uncharacterized protein n=1 Tax=Serratia rubidaea TaxID=61652 RepID=A0A4V6JHM5_SERRU|nr:Uncharacterised protein [Serratia rubidaea]